MRVGVEETEHFRRLNQYYEKSKPLYDILLWGSKHFGFYPNDKVVSEKEAQLLMQDLLAEKLMLSKSMRVLDAGCGEGVVSTYLAKKCGCYIEGVTVVPFELRRARHLAERLGMGDNVNYSLMDYSNMCFEDDSFDGIYTIEALSHATDVRRTLREFYRVLKKGGRVALFEYTLAHDTRFSDYEMGIVDNVIYTSAMDGLKEFRHDTFQGVMKDAGFMNVSVENISDNVKPSLNRLRKFLAIPYRFAKLFGLQNNCPNLTAAVEINKMAQRDLVRYNIFTAKK